MIDIELVYEHSLFSTTTLEQLFRVLKTNAPTWSGDARVAGDSRLSRAALGDPDSFRQALLVASERGPLYRQLVSNYGSGEERRTGSVEWRAPKTGVIVVTSGDDDPLAHTGGRLLLGNSITIQLRRERIEGRKAAEWAARVVADLASASSPVWGYAAAPAEYELKVFSPPPRIEAVGRDFSRYLPGLFWLNVFGSHYVSRFGRSRLLRTPNVAIEAEGDSVLLRLADDPSAWNSPEVIDREREVRQYLGVDNFFAPVRTFNRAQGGAATE